jgi:hypothetical protein
MPRGTILWVGLITLSIAIYYNWQEVQRTSICDTTYIYEGYADVPLPSDITAAFPRYKLVRYNDNAPQLQQGTFTFFRINYLPYYYSVYTVSINILLPLKFFLSFF